MTVSDSSEVEKRESSAGLLGGRARPLFFEDAERDVTIERAEADESGNLRLQGIAAMTDALITCGYCRAQIQPRDPFHVHGYNECLCGETPRHNAYLHDEASLRVERSQRSEDEKDHGGTSLTAVEGVSVSVHTPKLTHAVPKELMKCGYIGCREQRVDGFVWCLEHLRNHPLYRQAWAAASPATNHPLVHERGFIEAVEYGVYLAVRELVKAKLITGFER